MKIAFTPLLLLLFLTTVSAQRRSNTRPLILRGQLTDCPDRFLVMSFEDLNGQQFTDTIHLDPKGNFYLKTWKVTEPREVNIRFTKSQIGLCVAPGFDLTLTGNVSDMCTLFKTKKITGTGAACNTYRFMTDSILCTLIDKRKNLNLQHLKDSDMLADFNEEIRLYEAAATAAFDKKPTGDRNFDFFRQVTGYEILFTKLSKLLFLIDWFHYDNEKAIRLVKNNFDNQVLANIFKPEYMLSNFYKQLMDVQYLNYLLDLDYNKDTTLYNNKLYVLEKISKAYSGPIREYALHYRMRNMINAISSFKEFEATRKQLWPFIAGCTNAVYKKSLYNQFDEKKISLVKMQTGKPAPAFTLQSITGATHSLADYKGKVVYLDLWASWCAPCRAETPKLKTLYEKYKNDDRIAFLSIAVVDHPDKWRKAVEDDKPTWTQLIDKENMVADAYFSNLIPKFVLIDKQGNIVNADAPRPGSGKEIERLLQVEMAK